MFRKIIQTQLVMSTLAFHGYAFSYDSDALINAAGPYLMAADLQTKLMKSKCAYVSSRKAPSLELRYAEVKNTLNSSDRKELEDFYKSPDFRARTDRNQRIIDDLYAKFSTGTDDKTACGVLWGVLGPSFTKAEDDWKRAMSSLKR